MAFAQTSEQHSISEMNITPLVDVMLVMLVIFMIAAPIFSQPIPLNIGTGQGPQKKLLSIELRIDAVGDVYFNGNLVPLSALPSMFSAEAARAGEQTPALRIDASNEAEYQIVAKVLASAQNAGLQTIRFAK